MMRHDWRTIRDIYRTEYQTLGNFGPKHGVVLKQMLATGAMFIAPQVSALAQVRCVSQRRAVTMFPNGDGQFGRRRAGDYVMDALLVRTRAGMAHVQRRVARITAPLWCEVVPSAPYVAATMKAIGARRVGTRYTAEGDVVAVYLRAAPAERAERVVAMLPAERHTVVRLAVVPTRKVFREFVAAVNSVLSSGVTMAQHYSKKNTGQSWTALSLYGFSDDAADIAKPTVVRTKVCNPSVRQTRLLRQHPELARALVALLSECGAVRVERVRLMRLAASTGSGIARHSDLVDREQGVADGRIARMHLPLRTNRGATMTVWNDANRSRPVHLSVGQWFYLDARKPHAVQNKGRDDRVHLVADVLSSAAVRDVIERGSGVA